MRELVGDRGCIYTEGVYRGQQGPGQSGLWEWKNKEEEGVSWCPSSRPQPNGPRLRLLCSFLFFFFSDFFVPVTRASPKQSHTELCKVLSWLLTEAQCDQTPRTLDPLRSQFGNVNTETQATC